MGIPTVWLKCVDCGKLKVGNPVETKCRCGGRLEVDESRKVYRRG